MWMDKVFNIDWTALTPFFLSNFLKNAKRLGLHEGASQKKKTHAHTKTKLAKLQQQTNYIEHIYHHIH